MDTIKNKKPIDITPKHLKEISAREKIVIPEINYEMGAMLGGIKLGGDDSTINDRSIKTIASAINADGNFIKELINDKLNTSAKTILSDFNFGITDYAGAVKSGDIGWDANGENITGSGVAMYRKGLVGAFEGVIKFSLNAENGNAIFAGTLSAAAGTLGAITIGTNAWHVDNSGNMWWGNYASYAAASIKISAAGLVDFTTGNFSGTLASGISITSPVITGGTITGSTIQTNSGANTGIKISSSTNDITIFDGTQKVGTIYGSASSLWLQANVAGGNISFANGATLLATIDQNGNMALAPAGADFIVPSGGTFGWATYNIFLIAPSSTMISASTNFDIQGNLTLTGTVDGIDISSHAADASAHHSSTSSSLDITPATVVASGQLKGSILNSVSGQIQYNGVLFQDFYDQTTYGQIVFRRGNAGCDLLPYGDNYGQIGYASRRWSLVRAVTITSGDLVFENNFRFTEEGKTGISLYSPKNEKIAVFSQNGDIYVKGKIIEGNHKIFTDNIQQPKEVPLREIKKLNKKLEK